MTFRTYHQVHGRDASDLSGQVDAQRRRVEERLSRVRRIVAVMSGKGGVGKSYVTAALARGLAQRLDGSVGVLDADLNGPTTAAMLRASGPVALREDVVEPAVGEAGIKVFSTDLLLEEDAPLRWRGSESEQFISRAVLETGALREFLSDVAWGPLEYLLVDLPPGSAHVQDLVELVPRLAGALAVTIPSEESYRSVARAMRAALDRGVQPLGIIENMSGYACTTCGVPGPLFEGEAGARLAHAFMTPLLGRIPFRAEAGAPEMPRAVLDRFLETVA